MYKGKLLGLACVCHQLRRLFPFFFFFFLVVLRRILYDADDWIDNIGRVVRPKEREE